MMNSPRLAVALALIAGCVAPIDESALQSQDPIYTSTRVVLHPDGTYEVSVREIRASEQRRFVERKERFLRGENEVSSPNGLATTSQAISQDTNCYLGDFAFFTGTNLSGEQICFTGTGTAQLSNYSRTGGNWASGKNSFLAGGWIGRLQRPIDCSTYYSFGGWQQDDTLSSCNQNATHLLIDSAY